MKEKDLLKELNDRTQTRTLLRFGRNIKKIKNKNSRIKWVKFKHFFGRKGIYCFGKILLKTKVSMKKGISIMESREPIKYIL
jgi:hypothetical protein